jgi:hypothetical protein
MKTSGRSFAITRGFTSSGNVDTKGVDNLKNIKAAGMVGDVYFFPCRGKEAATQVNSFISYYDSHGRILLEEE